MSDTTVDQLRRGYEALKRGDVSNVLELLDPDIEWHEPAPSPEAGSYRGRDSFVRFFAAGSRASTTFGSNLRKSSSATIV